MERPETIFKFEPFSLQALQNLKTACFYFGSPLDFNDPYDCAIDAQLDQLSEQDAILVRDSFLADAAMNELQKAAVNELTIDQLKQQIADGAQKAIDTAKKNFLDTKGVTCFSEANENLLMWSHYGDKYRGFCLEFRTEFEPFNKLKKVEYVAEMPTLSTRDIGLNVEHGMAIEKLFCTKSTDWSYEMEWRVIHANAKQVYTYRPEALKAIYFGPRMPDQNVDLLCLILYSQIPDVRLFRGKKNPQSFRVDFSEITGYIPYAEARRQGKT